MARRETKSVNDGRRLATPQSVNAAIKSICDIMRRSNCAGALQYVPELTWVLFLRILDERERREAEAADAVGVSRSALSLIENGRRKVDAVELARFAEIYGQTIEALSGTAKTPPLPESVQALARAATELSAEDRNELLRFAEFLQARNPRSAPRG